MNEAAIDCHEMLRSMTDLRGKTAYVSGAGVGHGRATARLMAAAGARVLVGHVDADVAQATAQFIRDNGGKAAAAELDTASEQSVLDWFDAGRSLGPPDIMVNAATHFATEALVDMDSDLWDTSQRINLRGVFLCMREAIKSMKASGTGGSIINVTTIGGIHPVRSGNAAYSSAKAAVHMLTRNAAHDHGKEGIRVNALAPGAIITEDVLNPDPRHNPNLPSAAMERHLSGMGDPTDIAMASIFLAGLGGRYINGQVLVVDGGFLVG